MWQGAGRELETVCWGVGGAVSCLLPSGRLPAPSRVGQHVAIETAASALQPPGPRGGCKSSRTHEVGESRRLEGLRPVGVHNHPQPLHRRNNRTGNADAHTHCHMHRNNQGMQTPAHRQRTRTHAPPPHGQDHYILLPRRCGARVQGRIGPGPGPPAAAARSARSRRAGRSTRRRCAQPAGAAPPDHCDHLMYQWSFQELMISRPKTFGRCQNTSSV